MKEIKLKVNDIDVKFELLIEGTDDDHALVKAIPPHEDKSCTYYVKKSVLEDGKNQIHLAIYLKKSASKDMDFHQAATSFAEKVVDSMWECLTEAQKESAERERDLQITMISDKIESELFEDFIAQCQIEKVQ